MASHAHTAGLRRDWKPNPTGFWPCTSQIQSCDETIAGSPGCAAGDMRFPLGTAMKSRRESYECAHSDAAEARDMDGARERRKQLETMAKAAAAR